MSIEILDNQAVTVPLQLRHIDAAKVTVGGLLGHRLELTWRANLLQLNWERDFLAPFRAQRSEAGSYVGLGKTLDGLIHFAHLTGDAELLKLKQRVVSELIATQLEDGYVGLYAPEDRLDRCWDVHEQAYLIFALVSDWRCFREEASLQTAIRLGEYLVSNLSRERMQRSEPELSKTLVFCGLDRALLALYGATCDKRYLDFCIQEIDLASWDLPILEGRHGQVEGHAYAYLARSLAQLELYQLTGDKKLFSQSRRALDFLRRQHGLVVSGTSGIDECWHSDHTGCGDLGETCATAYLIRLCERLLCLQADGRYSDLMERSIYNALFGAQSPDGRQLRYYVPFEGERGYWPLDTYCCPGNFRRIMGELPEMIYYLCEDGLAVSLYTESKLEAEIRPDLTLNLHQETHYPTSDTVVFHIQLSRSAELALYLRRPSWCELYSLSVNGDPIEASEDNGFLRVARRWESGDTLQFDMSMPARLVRGIEKQSGRAAVMAGPVVYTLNPALNPQISGLDSAEIVLSGDIVGPFPNDCLYPHGSACSAATSNLPGELLLTEFADPGGVRSYFLFSEDAFLVDDCLLEK